MELYLNNSKADLAPDTVFAVTVQSNDITKPDSVQSSYSNSLTLPYTERNHRLLENANQVNGLSDTPYQVLDCQVLSDGTEVLPLPKAYLRQAGDGYEVDVFSGSLDFFDRLGDKSIQELDLSRFDHVRNAANVVTGANGTRTYLDGYLYEPIANGKPFSLAGIWAEDMYPSVFVRTVFEQLLLEAGVSYTGISDAYWDRLVLPFSNDKPVHPVGYGTARFLFSNVFTPDPFLPVTEYGLLKIVVNATMTRISTNVNAIPKLWIQVRRDGVEVLKKELEMSRLGAYELKADFRVEPYEDLSKLQVWAGPLAWEADSANISQGGWSAGYTYDSEHFYLTPWDTARNLPDMKQKDFFKAVRALFDLMVSFDPYSNTLTLTPFNDLEANKSKALDWSDKLVKVSGHIPVQFRFGDFAQKSWFRYKEDEEGVTGDHYLQIADVQLEPEKDVIELPFAASQSLGGVLAVPLFEAQVKDPADYDAEVNTINDRNNFGADNTKKILVKDASADPFVREGWAVYENVQGRFNSADGWAIVEQAGYHFKPRKVEPRIALLQEYGTSFTIKESRTVSTVVNGRGSEFGPLSFAQLLPTRYTSLLGVLTKTKGITPAILLDVTEVQGYDPAIPIWLEEFQSYFYLNSINEFTGEGPTECQMWRL